MSQITLVMGNRSQMSWDLPALDSFELQRAIYGIQRAEFEKTRDEFIELLEIGELVKKPIRNLSLGERMKMEIVGGKMQLGGKKELRRLLGFSPDHFDWLLMTYWKPDHLFRKVSSGKAGKGVDFKGVFLR